MTHDHDRFIEALRQRGAIKDDADTIAAELADVARLIDRADAEASRLRARRLQLWREARDAGLSWRAIAGASGVDHAQIAKAVGSKGRGTRSGTRSGEIDV